MTDQNKKSLRQFQCRDYLWEIFEQMSGELECSVDYLINEAMRQYARSRNYGARTDPTGPSPAPAGRPSAPGPLAPQPAPVGGPATSPAIAAPAPSGFGAAPAPVAGARPRIPSQPAIASAPPPPLRPAPPGYGAPPPGYGAPAAPPSYGQPTPAPAYAAPAPAYPAPPPPARPSGYGSTTGSAAGYPAPPAAGYPSGGYPSSPGVQPGYAAPPPPPRPVTGAPPPLPAPPPTAAPGSAPGVGSPLLYVIFNGQKYPVNKEEFIIGRGAKTADLPIKDGNISRRHAAIIFQNGAYYMKDLGSTNGVEYQGRRVDGRHIQEGDVYQLCDYELRFTYR